ncbi:unnamed protein product [Dibothriocephalus latus]|uniref:Uncharacterized protein n=1 Tax=Dibothriocephalus latus TaxID=60516 RepID=A0A3P7RXC8_DIBLA|nr:unnamed protein product [Dibothriocephalus latus]
MSRHHPGTLRIGSLNFPTTRSGASFTRTARRSPRSWSQCRRKSRPSSRATASLF